MTMVTGLILIAAGLTQAVRSPTATPSGVHAYFLGIGTALYVLTFCYTRARMFGGIGVLRLVGGLAAALVSIMGPFAPLIATLAVLTALLIALNAVEAWWVASGRPLLVLRTGRGAMPDTGYSTSAPAR